MTAVLPEAASPPRLRITVEGAEAVGFAASPTLRFLLRWRRLSTFFADLRAIAEPVPARGPAGHEHLLEKGGTS